MVVLLFAWVFLSFALPQTFLSGQEASFVAGQGDFTTSTTNYPSGAPSSEGLAHPQTVAVGPDASVIVGDTDNFRALHYPFGARIADDVWFQERFDNVNPANNISPNCVCFDKDSNVFTCSGNRVLFSLKFSPGVIARVYGQPNETANDAGLGPDRLNSPRGCGIMTDGTVAICDQGNNRVVFFKGNSTAGFKFLGQPDGYSGGYNSGRGFDSPSQGGLACPTDVAFNSKGDFVVVDGCNNRVLFYQAEDLIPVRVYGQASFFEKLVVNPPSAGTLSSPWGAVFDSGDNLFISDKSNNRILVYPASGSTTAVAVLGQIDFVSNNPATSKTGVRTPLHISFDPFGRLFVADEQNNRVICYGIGGIVLNTSVSLGSNELLVGDYLVPYGSPMLAVVGNLTVVGSLLLNGNVSVGPNAVINVQGTLSAAGGFTVAAGASIIVNGTFVVRPGAVLDAVIDGSMPVGTIVTAEIASFTSSSGSFSSVTSQSSTALSACTGLSQPSVSTTVTTISIAVSIVDTCHNGGGLSTGGLIEIIFGVAVVVLAVIVATAVIRLTSKKRTAEWQEVHRRGQEVTVESK